MKFTKASIFVLIATFVVFAVAVANLVYCLCTPANAKSVPMAIGIAVIMGGIFVACIITAIKDAKRNADGTDDADDDDEDDDE